MKKGKTKVTNFLFNKNVINNDKLAVTHENKNVIKIYIDVYNNGCT